MTPEEELQRAEEARQVLDSGIFKEAVSEVESALINGIRMSPIKDAELREKLCQQLIQLGAVVGHIRSVMETGKLAEATIKQRRGASR